MAEPDPKLMVRISCVGHASRRWKSARTATEAESLNQQLSDARADSVRRAAEEIVRRELPNLSIAVPSKGVGIHEPFPTAGENNAAIDRSVLVTVELTLADTAYTFQAAPPRKVYVPSKIWSLTVVSKVQESVGVAGVFLRVSLRNPYSGRSLYMSGYLFGGTIDANPENWFKIKKGDPRDLIKPIGREVAFSTPKAMDFDDWRNSGAGHLARMMGEDTGLFIVKSKVTLLQFTGIDTDPGSLIFEYNPIKLGLGMPSLADTLVAGALKVDGGNSNDFDYLELARAPDIIPTEKVRRFNDGLLLSFPTGKSSLHDLAESDRKQLTEFVTLKSRIIGAFSQSFKYTP